MFCYSRIQICFFPSTSTGSRRRGLTQHCPLPWCHFKADRPITYQQLLEIHINKVHGSYNAQVHINPVHGTTNAQSVPGAATRNAADPSIPMGRHYYDPEQVVITQCPLDHCDFESSDPILYKEFLTYHVGPTHQMTKEQFEDAVSASRIYPSWHYQQNQQYPGESCYSNVLLFIYVVIQMSCYSNVLLFKCFVIQMSCYSRIQICFYSNVRRYSNVGRYSNAIVLCSSGVRSPILHINRSPILQSNRKPPSHTLSSPPPASTPQPCTSTSTSTAPDHQSSTPAKPR